MAVPPGGDSSHGVDELPCPRDALLQHVAHARVSSRQQIDGVSGLNVLGQDENAHLRKLALELDGGLQALGRVRRRHPNVDDDGVGPVDAHGCLQSGGVGELGDDFNAFVGEQPGNSGAHQGCVVHQHHAQRRLHAT